MHTCCGPCTLMPLELLIQENFLPSTYFFNPNIHLQKEYLLRLYAMQEVTKYYNIPLIIQGNTSFFQELKNAFHNFPKKISLVNRIAFSYCIPLLFEKNFEKKNDLKWNIALEKILIKWKNYTQGFSEFSYENFKNTQNIKFAQSSKNIFLQDETTINAPLFIARLALKHENPYCLKQTLKKSLFLETKRCKTCYQDRLFQTALYASQNGFDTFTTTLLYSRYQNHDEICQAAYEAEENINRASTTNHLLKPIKFYYKDFRSFWQEGIDKSKELNLYRQKWCGCNLSRLESLERMTKRAYEKIQ